MMNRQQLTLRLQTVYDTARVWRDQVNGDKGIRLIDVGSDHGYVSLEALITGDYSKVVATDIHKDPADKTRSTLVSHGYAEQSTVVCTDGLKGVDLIDGDTVIMAGLGGNNMMDIISAAMEVTPQEVLKSVVWCLQPQKTIEELRVYLCQNGFEIKDEVVVNERGIHYPMLVAVFDGIKREINLYQKYFGPVLPNKKNEEMVAAYFDKLDGIYTLRARGDREIAELMDSLKEGSAND